MHYLESSGAKVGLRM